VPFLRQESDAVHDVPLGTILIPAVSIVGLKLQALWLLAGFSVHPEAPTFEELQLSSTSGLPGQVTRAEVTAN
jgi:hypothetical protein